MYFFSYDIADAKRLSRVAKKLENFGLRVQKSFFQCEMSKEKMRELREAILKTIDKKYDSFFVYAICDDCVKKVQSIGNGKIFEFATYQIL